MKELNDLGSFNLIYADPPWRYDFDVASRATEKHYPTLLIPEIIALRPPTQKDALLLMWATAPKLPQALQVVQEWGFTYKTHMIWAKPQIGLGWWVRNQHELLLIATKGSPGVPLGKDRIGSVQTYPRTKHSAKPLEFYDIIDRMFPYLTDRLEMFARNTREGWISWGNEV